MEPPVLVAITFYTVVLALLLFIGFLAYKLGKVTITGLFALGTKAGGSPLVSLICFAIAVAMFREPLKYVVGAVSNSSLFVVDEYLRQLNDITFEANNEVASQLVSQTIRMTTYLLYGLITNLQLERFPIAQTIFLLSAWLVLAAAVQIISDRVRAERAGADDTVKKASRLPLRTSVCSLFWESAFISASLQRQPFLVSARESFQKRSRPTSSKISLTG